MPWGGAANAARQAFVQAHQALYGFSLDVAAELVTLRVEASGRLPQAVMAQVPAGPMPAPAGSMVVHFAQGDREVPLYDRASLRAGNRFAGPAIVTQLDATTLVPPGWTVEVHSSASLVLRRHTSQL